MQTVHKFILTDHSMQIVQMPALHRILHVGKQLKYRFAHTEGQPSSKHTQVCMWVEVDTDSYVKPISIYNVATGDQIPDNCRYVGTVVVSVNDVRHIYVNEA